MTLECRLKTSVVSAPNSHKNTTCTHSRLIGGDTAPPKAKKVWWRLVMVRLEIIGTSLTLSSCKGMIKTYRSLLFRMGWGVYLRRICVLSDLDFLRLVLIFRRGMGWLSGLGFWSWGWWRWQSLLRRVVSCIGSLVHICLLSFWSRCQKKITIS